MNSSLTASSHGTLTYSFSLCLNFSVFKNSLSEELMYMYKKVMLSGFGRLLSFKVSSFSFFQHFYIQLLNPNKCCTDGSFPDNTEIRDEIQPPIVTGQWVRMIRKPRNKPQYNVSCYRVEPSWSRALDKGSEDERVVVKSRVSM